MSDTYMTAEQLGITEEERNAFIKVMEYLRGPTECSVLPDDDKVYTTNRIPNDQIETKLGFSMAFQAQALIEGERPPEFYCGAVACIGGHVSLIMQGIDVLKNECILLTREQADQAISYVGDSDDDDARQRLFFPPEDDVKYNRWRSITPESASFAVENFLTKVDPDWRDALQRGGQEHLIVEDD